MMEKKSQEMIRISILLALLVLIYYAFSSLSICSGYDPLLVSTSGYDSLFKEGFLIINTHDCSQDEVDFLDRRIAEQNPIAVIRSNSDDLNRHLIESITYCNDLASRVNSTHFKILLTKIDSAYFKHTDFNDFYINYFDGEYNAVPMVGCRDSFYVSVASDRIVVFDNLGISGNGVDVMLDADTKSISRAHLYCVLVLSILDNHLTTDAPMYLDIALYILLSALCILSVSLTNRFVRSWLLKYVIIKGSQVIFFILVFMILIALADFNFVYHVQPALACVLISCELMFWFLFVQNKLKKGEDV